MDKQIFAACLGVVDAEKEKLLKAIRELETNKPADARGIQLYKDQLVEAQLIGFKLKKLFDSKV